MYPICPILFQEKYNTQNNLAAMGGQLGGSTWRQGTRAREAEPPRPRRPLFWDLGPQLPQESFLGPSRARG
jgi:hypothetical protein